MKLGMEVPFGGKNEPIVWLAPFSDLSHHPTNLLVNPSKANLGNFGLIWLKIGGENLMCMGLYSDHSNHATDLPNNHSNR